MSRVLFRVFFKMAARVGWRNRRAGGKTWTKICEIIRFRVCSVVGK